MWVIGMGLLALNGCAKQQETEVTGSTNAAATPGSQQDFVVNVGDRVFFQTDSVELTTQARQTRSALRPERHDSFLT